MRYYWAKSDSSGYPGPSNLGHQKLYYMVYMYASW